jgi:hypothetical protein
MQRELDARCGGLQESVAGFLACWLLKVAGPKGAHSENADWKVRNTLCALETLRRSGGRKDHPNNPVKGWPLSATVKGRLEAEKRT